MTGSGFFRFNTPGNNQIQACDLMRIEASRLFHAIKSMCPDGREKSLACTKLEECVMWANTAILRHGAKPDDLESCNE